MACINSCTLIFRTYTLIIIFQEDLAFYGIDWSGPIPNFDDVDSIEITETRNPLEGQDFLHLQATISPLGPSECHGVDLYIQTLEFVHQKLS